MRRCCSSSGNGYRVVAHDRRGHGRSTQVVDGHDMDHYAADAAAVVEHLDLRDAVHVGHSTGGGEVDALRGAHGTGPRRQGGAHRRRAADHGEDPANPGGLPIEVFDGFRAGTRRQPRPVLSRPRDAVPSTASTGPGAKAVEAVIDNWWRQGMIGGAKAHYDGIKAFSETDFTEDLKSIDVPTFVMHGDDDQIVPYKDSALLSVKLLKHGTLKIYPGYPHGMLTTHADVINQDLLAFVRHQPDGGHSRLRERSAG